MNIGHIVTHSPSIPLSSCLIFLFLFFSLFSTQLSPPPTSFCFYMTKAQQLLLSLSPSLTHCNVITLTVRSNETRTHT